MHRQNTPLTTFTSQKKVVTFRGKSVPLGGELFRSVFGIAAADRSRRNAEQAPPQYAGALVFPKRVSEDTRIVQDVRWSLRNR